MATASRRFGCADRVLASGEYRDVTRRGVRSSSREFVLLWLDDDSHSGGERARLGLTVSRKVGNAVVRNRVKRRVREWFRDGGRNPLSAGSLVVIARRSAVKLDWIHLCRLLDRQVAEIVQ